MSTPMPYLTLLPRDSRSAHMEEEEEEGADVKMHEIKCHDVVRGVQDDHHVDDEVVFMENG